MNRVSIKPRAYQSRSRQALPHSEGIDVQLSNNPTKLDMESSATIRDLRSLDRALSYVDVRGGVLADLGCGYGWLGRYVADRFQFDEVLGFDVDDERMAVAAKRGIKTTTVDLERDPYPISDASVDLAVSFGTLEHFVWWDHFVAEAGRILRPGGSLILAAPNLGSYLNRAALLLGYQPRDVAVSHRHLVGVLPQYRRGPLGHVHIATLRASNALLRQYGFKITAAVGSSPDFENRMVRTIDRVLGRSPSLARRYIIVARR